jgi:hypothetical protein
MKKLLTGAIGFAIVYFLFYTGSSILLEDQHFQEIWGKAAIAAIATGILFELFVRFLLGPILRYLKRDS